MEPENDDIVERLPNGFLFKPPKETRGQKFIRLFKKYIWLMIIGIPSLIIGCIFSWDNVKSFYHDTVQYFLNLF
jgi:hypothetical protein